MADLSRRAALGALAAAPIATAALSNLSPAPAGAAVPLSGQQAPGFYRTKVGDIEVTIIHDGHWMRPKPTEGFIRNAKPEDVAAALGEAFQPTDALRIPFNFTAVNTGKQLVMIDTGTGAQAAPTATVGAANMAAAGIDPAKVDLVVISHFHGDHINGLTTKDGQRVYPNAEILVPEAEWGFWMDDGQMSRAAEALQGNFKNARARFKPYEGRVRPYKEGEVAPGITAISTHGHTPGHTSFQIGSGNSLVLIQSDVTNVPFLFVRNPGWHAIFDMDPAKAEETRRKFYDRAAADKATVIGYHFPFPAMGHVRKRDAGYELVPVFWSSAL